jgi:glycosyltransferase involved in cell wall biosynthesis
MRVLYIADGSITKPILRSQGLPHLSQLAQKGYEVFLLSFEVRTTQANYSLEAIRKRYGDRIHFLPVPMLPASAVRLQLQMLMLGPFITIFQVARLRIRCIHARSYIPAILGLVAKQILAVKLIFDMRGLMIDEFISQGKWTEGSLQTRLMRWFEKKCILNADEVAVVSEQFRQHVLTRKYVFKETYNRPVTVIPNCVDLSRFGDESEVSQELRQQLGIENKVTIVYAGSLDPWQLPDEMVRFFLIFLKSCSEAFFLFVTYTEPAPIRNLLKSANVDPSKYLVVQANPEDVPHYLSLGTVGMLFRRNEILNRVACPLKFAEYLAAGVPVLLTKGVGDTEQIVKDHNVGLVINSFAAEDMQEAAARLMHFIRENSSQLHARCRTVARQQFSLEAAVQKYLAIYGRLAA